MFKRPGKLPKKNKPSSNAPQRSIEQEKEKTEAQKIKQRIDDAIKRGDTNTAQLLEKRRIKHLIQFNKALLKNAKLHGNQTQSIEKQILLNEQQLKRLNEQ